MREVNNVIQETNRRVGSPSALQPKPNSTDHLLGSVGSSALSQSVSTAKTQTAQTANGTSADAEVPANPQALAVQPPIVPLPAGEALVFLGVKPDIGSMTLEEKFGCLKQCFSYGYGVRKVLCQVFEAIRTEFKTYTKNRAGMPTVEQAFAERGLNYKTIYSAIQREKDRRTEDAQFFAAIKAQASTNNIHGLDITDDDLPPVGTKVILGDGTQGQVLAIGQKAAPDSEPSLEIITEEGRAVQIKRGDLITFAEKEAAKAAERAEKVAKALEAQDDGGKREESKTKRIAAAAAKADHAAKSDAFYAAQYFNLLAMINSAPKEFSRSEFTQSVMEQLQVAYEALGEDAQRVSRVQHLFPTIAQGNENELFTFLSADAVGRKSLVNIVFGGIGKESFRDKVGKFAQRICDLFHDGRFQVSVTDKTQPAPKVKKATAAARPPEPDRPQTTKVGDKSIPTAHGFFYEFRVHAKLPYVVRDANNPNLAILTECRNRAEAEFKISTYDREATAAAIAAAI
jgi:hypothetical protein